MISILRYLGSFCLVLGYVLLLYGNLTIGILIRLFGNLLSIPFAVKNKYWDIVAICSFFAAIETHKLILSLI